MFCAHAPGKVRRYRSVNVVSQFAYIYAIADEDHVMYAAPIIAAYCAASVLWSRIFLREKLSWRHYLMLVLIVIGIVLLGILDL